MLLTAKVTSAREEQLFFPFFMIFVYLNTLTGMHARLEGSSLTVLWSCILEFAHRTSHSSGSRNFSLSFWVSGVPHLPAGFGETRSSLPPLFGAPTNLQRTYMIYVPEIASANTLPTPHLYSQIQTGLGANHRQGSWRMTEAQAGSQVIADRAPTTLDYS